MESPLRHGSEPDLKLIETMLWDGMCYPRLAGHLARLTRSAEELGFRCDIRAAEAALPKPAGPARVRLTLDRAGQVEVTQAPLPAASDEWRITRADARLSSADPWLRHKTTRRALYDATRAALPAGVDEVLFLNERDEVCEGTITNVFFDRGQGMRTPRVACGLLPGVLRAELGLPEEVLLAEDLGRVRLWVGNALRGLIPARLT